MNLTYPTFEIACQTYLSKYSSSSSIDNELDPSRYSRNWQWQSGIGYLPNNGGLSRSFVSSSDLKIITVCQQILFSSTWKVPILYFQVFWQSGQPLSFQQVVSCSVFLQDKEKASSILSYGDHPRSCLPSFFLHPCQTSQLIQLILSNQTNTITPNHTSPPPPTPIDPVQYLEAFINLCSTVIEMRV